MNLASTLGPHESYKGVWSIYLNREYSSAEDTLHCRVFDLNFGVHLVPTWIFMAVGNPIMTVLVTQFSPYLGT